MSFELLPLSDGGAFGLRIGPARSRLPRLPSHRSEQNVASSQLLHGRCSIFCESQVQTRMCAGGEELCGALRALLPRRRMRWRRPTRALLGSIFIQFVDFSIPTQVGKNYAARCARCGAKKEALAAADEGSAAMEALFLKGAPAVDELVEVARALRRLPQVDPFLPTVHMLKFQIPIERWELCE